MAILKHIASKNANYGSAIDYLKYQHDEFHLVPVLDESGNMLLREEFYPERTNTLYKTKSQPWSFLRKTRADPFLPYYSYFVSSIQRIGYPCA